jgi:myosin protein heavy chain
VDRIVKDLQSQIDRKDKQNGQLQDDVGRMRDKVDKLLKTIDELQASESSNQLSARRAERELREEKEKCLRLERELEGWKNLRMEKGSSGSVAGSVLGGGSIRGTDSIRKSSAWRTTLATSEDDDIKVPPRKSSISRAPSLTKGFL